MKNIRRKRKKCPTTWLKIYSPKRILFSKRMVQEPHPAHRKALPTTMNHLTQWKLRIQQPHPTLWKVLPANIGISR